MIRYAVAAIVTAASTTASAATLNVGAGQTFATLSAAAAKANPGDTVVVYPGIYTTGAIWYDSNLTIRAATGSPPGSVIVRGGTVGGKALFVTKGSDITISGIRFENARVSSGNGAGIRAEGKNLTIVDSQFYGNEMGILANSVAGSKIIVRGSSFDLTKSRRSGSIGHAVYANSIGALIVENSTFKRGTKGHYIKSRARSATITGNRIDDTNGSASYLIDLSEGGGARIADNVLIKGAKAENCCTAIAYGFEMKKGGTFVNPPGDLLVTGNSFTNLRASNVTFFANRSAPPNTALLSGNTMIATKGTIRLYSGPATQAGFATPLSLDLGESAILVNEDTFAFATLAQDFRLEEMPVTAAAANTSRFEALADSAVIVSETGTFALFGFGIMGVFAARRKWRARPAS